MPCLKIFTNLPRSSVPNDFVSKITPLLSRVVNKPVESFTCMVSSDCLISFGGESTKPGAAATLESIGHLGLQENKVIATEVAAFVEKELGITQDRFFLSFYDIKAQDIFRGKF